MKRFALLLAIVFVGPAFGQGKQPADFGYVPSDAALVVHSRIADLWKSEGMKDIRRIVMKAGPEAFAMLDKRFSPPPSSAESITGFLMMPKKGGSTELDFAVICNFTQAFDQQAFVKFAAPKAVAKKGKLLEWYDDTDSKAAIVFPGPKTFAFGSSAAIARMANMPAKSEPTGFASEFTDPKKLMVLQASASAFPPDAIDRLKQELPPRLHALLLAKSAVISVDDAAESRVALKVDFGNKADADNANEAIKAGIDMLKGLIADARVELKKLLEGDGGPGKLEDLPFALAGVAGLGALQEVEDFLVQLPIKREGTAYAFDIPIPSQIKPLFLSSGIAASLLVPAVQKVRSAANRVKSQNNLKQMAIGMHVFHDDLRYFPNDICDPTGKPLLSWRVAILPYIEQEGLYRQFKLNEPWDSEHNKPLSEILPYIYQIPGANEKKGYTHYRRFIGKDTPWPKQSDKLTIARITDGTSNTWMIVEAEEPVIWTKPEGLELDPKKPPKMGTFQNGGFNVAFFDGSVRMYQKLPKSYLLYINPADGQVIPADDK